MTELSPEARAILEAARRVEQPPPGDAARIRAAVLARAGLPGAEAAPVEAAPAAGSAPVAGGGMGLAGKLAIALAVAALAAGSLWLLRDRDGATAPGPVAALDRPMSPGATPGQDTPGSLAAVQGEPAADDAVEIEPAVDQAVEIEPTAETSRPRSSSRGSRRRPASGPPAASPASTLAEELVWIDRAKRALDTDAAAEALDALATHRARFPRGALTEERVWLQIRAFCELGRTRAAVRQAARFQRRWPSSPYLQKVRASCGVVDDAAGDLAGEQP